MILKARHNAIIHPFFKWYSTWKSRSHFNPIIISGEVTDRGWPILLVSNHISWWDGFWAMHVNSKLFRRKFHFMMEESQLRKYWFFNHSGGFSVQKNTRSIIETLNYSAELLSDCNNLVLLFPQGEIQSVYQQEISFGKGIERILHQCGQVEVIFQVLMTDYFSHPKPGLYIYLKEYRGENHDRNSLQEAFRQFYRESADRQIRRAK